MKGITLLKKNWKGMFLILLSIGVLVYVNVAPFNPPVFHGIFGAAIVSELWCIDYLIRIHKEKPVEKP